MPIRVTKFDNWGRQQPIEQRRAFQTILRVGRYLFGDDRGLDLAKGRTETGRGTLDGGASHCDTGRVSAVAPMPFPNSPPMGGAARQRVYVSRFGNLHQKQRVNKAAEMEMG